MRPIATDVLLDAVTVTGASASRIPWGTQRTFQAIGYTSSGAGSAVVDIQVSNNGSDWITFGTITLTLSTTSSSDGFATDAAWKHARANLSTLSGTGATVTVIMGNVPR